MDRPNILILYTDQQRWDAVGCNGNAEIKTPNLDKMARGGLNFDRFFVQNPVCMPSRVSFLSGQYPSQLKITHMGVPVPENLPTLPHLLRNYGYTSANIGKLHFLPHACRDHREVHPAYGFDHLEISDEPGCYEDAYRAWVRRKAPGELHFLPHACRDHREVHPAYGFDHLEISDEPGCYEDAYRAWVRRKAPGELDKISCGLPPATAIWQKALGFRDGIKHPEVREPRTAAFPSRSDLTHTAFVAEQTIEFIRRCRAGPFLCIAGFYSPHSPWVAPQEFLDLYDPTRLSVPKFPDDVNAKRGERFSDAALQRIKQGYYAMITEVDHHVGRILACLDEEGLADDTIVLFTSDHGEYLGEFLRFGKGFPGEDCISRVPLLLRWPKGITRPGETIRHIVEAVDVVPTLLDWAGIPIPAYIQGVPLPASNDDARTKASALLESTQGKSLRMDRCRYIVRENGREELYDLTRELGEYSNVASDPSYAAALSEARGEMVRRLVQVERPMPRIWPY